MFKIYKAVWQWIYGLLLGGIQDADQGDPTQWTSGNVLSRSLVQRCGVEFAGTAGVCRSPPLFRTPHQPRLMYINSTAIPPMAVLFTQGSPSHLPTHPTGHSRLVCRNCHRAQPTPEAAVFWRQPRLGLGPEELCPEQHHSFRGDRPSNVRGRHG